MGESWTTNERMEDGMFLLPTTNTRWEKVGQQTNKLRTECFYFLRQIKEGRKLDSKQTNEGRKVFISYVRKINERESFHFL